MFESILLGVIGPNQILIIAVVIVLLFGARKIPQLMKGIGQGIKEFKNAQLLIFNNLGEKIYSCTYDGTKTVNCKTFSKGIYFVRIANGERQLTKKLVVE